MVGGASLKSNLRKSCPHVRELGFRCLPLPSNVVAIDQGRRVAHPRDEMFALIDVSSPFVGAVEDLGGVAEDEEIFELVFGRRLLHQAIRKALLQIRLDRHLQPVFNAPLFLKTCFCRLKWYSCSTIQSIFG